MAHHWRVNLTESAIPVYDVFNSSLQLGQVNNNECCVDGMISANPYEGDGEPVIFVNMQHVMTFGILGSYQGSFGNFVNYASNGTSWSAVNTLERKVQYATKAYYSNGNFCCDLAVGSRVWLSSSGAAGDNNDNYISVSKVKTADDTTYNLNSHGFVDLTYGNRWVTVGSILLRKV